MAQYVVTGACAYATGTDPATGGTYRQLFYQGQPVPAAATVEEIEHNLSVGLIADVDAVLEEPAVPGSTVLVEPSRGASTADWAAFALAGGATESDIEGLGRDALVEKFGAPAA